LKDLPKNIEDFQLKKIANVKHVISTTIDVDSITNQCTGTGRIKVRLQTNEDAEQVRINFLKEGY
jgi:hypothetical protein